MSLALLLPAVHAAALLHVHHLLSHAGEELPDDGAQLRVFAQGVGVWRLGDHAVERAYKGVHLHGLGEQVLVLRDRLALGPAWTGSVLLLAEEEHVVHEAGLCVRLVAADVRCPD